jgi:hypothetical protein
VAAEARVDDEEVLVAWFCELEKEDTAAQVIDVGKAVADKCGGEFVGYDLATVGEEKRQEGGRLLGDPGKRTAASW